MDDADARDAEEHCERMRSARRTAFRPRDDTQATVDGAPETIRLDEGDMVIFTAFLDRAPEESSVSSLADLKGALREGGGNGRPAASVVDSARCHAPLPDE